jgi:molybdopterin-guanine dinucleotide biosynthesis protein A
VVDASSIPTDAITGLVLAGGRGQRMQGRDKGLQPYLGRPLALHALERLAPQVGSLLLSANRHLDDYRAFGVPVLPDAIGDFPGPLAGWLTALPHCRTPWLASVPCDTPHFPLDLIERLSRAAAQGNADLAVAATRGDDGGSRMQPVFCLLKAALAPSLQRYLSEGGRRVQQWVTQQRHVTVPFDDTRAFRNFNTLEDLERTPDA